MVRRPLCLPRRSRITQRAVALLHVLGRKCHRLAAAQAAAHQQGEHGRFALALAGGGIGAVDESFGLRLGQPVPCPHPLQFNASNLIDSGGGFRIQPDSKAAELPIGFLGFRLGKNFSHFLKQGSRQEGFSQKTRVSDDFSLFFKLFEGVAGNVEDFQGRP